MRKKDHSLFYEMKMKVVMKWYVKTTDQNTYMQKFNFTSLTYWIPTIIKKFVNNRQEQKQAKGTWHQILCLYW